MNDEEKRILEIIKQLKCCLGLKVLDILYVMNQLYYRASLAESLANLYKTYLPDPPEE